MKKINLLRCILFFPLLMVLAGTLQAIPPTTAATNLQFSNIGAGQMYLFCSAGDGARRIIVASASGPVTGTPADGTDYNASSTFGSGDQLNPGEFVIYDGGSVATWLYGLSVGTTYDFAVFEYNGTGFSTEYLTSSFLAGSQATVTTPAVQSSGLSISTVTGNSMTLNWTNGDGFGRMVVMKAGSAVDSNPVDLTTYSASTSFGFGTQLGSGNYVVYRGTANTTTVSNLQPGITYHISIFEYNGSTSSTYLIPGLTGNQLTATTPTAASSTPVFQFTQGNYFRLTWSSGNGGRRIVVLRAGSPVTGVPTDGVDYNSNSTFGLGDQLNPGEYVVYDNSGGLVDIFGLVPNTTYHIAIFEYNGTGTNTYYLTSSFPAGSHSTLGPPSTQASAITFGAVTGSSMQVSWTNGDGNGRIVVMKEGSPVDSDPVDVTNYGVSSNFGFGSQIGTGNYVVYQSSGSSVTINNLNPGQTYHVAVYEYNGTSGRVYLTPAATASQMTGGAPTVSASNFGFNFIDGNYFRMTWTTGNGNRRIVVARAGSPVSGTPTDGVDYTHSSTFGSGDTISPGEFVVYDNSGSLVDLFGLSPATTYHFAVFEYNGTGANIIYQQVAAGTASQATLSAPATGASGLAFSNVTGSSMQISWTNGSGTARLVVIREGNPVSGIPANLSSYSASTVYGSGSQIGAGNYVIYSSTASQVTVTNLNPATTYHIEIFEYNGSSGRVYRIPGATGSQLTGGAPTVSASNLQFQFVTATTMRLTWTGGNGTRRIVVARAGAAVSTAPANGVAYTASSIFGIGDQISPGEFVVYDGTSSLVDLSGLPVSTTYHFAVIEYNGTGASALYQQAGFLIGSQSSAQPPAIGASGITFPVVNTTSMTVGWTNGSGAGRLVVAVEASATLSSQPVSGTNYNWSQAFGSGASIGNGFVVYRGNASTATITGLQSGTNYTFCIFEYNGSAFSPAFLIPGVSGIQLTSGAPAIQPSNPIFSAIQTTAATISWTNGGGQNRIVVVRPASAVVGVPVDGTAYNANTFFGSGDQLAAGEFIVFAGNGSSVTVTNLQPGTGYQIAIFEYNGSGATSLFNPVSPAVGTFSADALPFPVEWLGVDVLWSDNAATIRWTTGSEVNSNRFEVERKRGGRNWEVLGQSAAMGNGAAPTTYYWEDGTAQDRDVYRVVEIDFDGNRSISNQVELRIPYSLTFAVFPNPVSEVLTIRAEESLGWVEMIDGSGRTVKRIWTSESEVSIEVRDLSDGVYWIVTSEEKHRKPIRIIRQER